MENLQRKSNFELLRLIAMFLVVLHHFCIHGIILYHETASLNINHFNIQACEFLSIGGPIANDIFIIITGYFMITSSFKFKKVLKLYLQTLFYSLSIFFIFTLISGQNLLQYSNHPFFPVNLNSYWFMTNYLGLYLLSPFINIIVKKMSKKMNLSLLITICLVWSILPTLTSINLYYSILGWFIFLYILGAYIRLYPKKIYDNLKFNILSLFLLASLYILILNGYNHFFISKIIPSIRDIAPNTTPILIMALNIFFIFKNIDIKSAFINSIAKSVFAVYLIHDNELVRPFLWQGLLHVATYMNSNYFILWALLISFCVFITCIVIDQTNIAVFNLIKKVLNKIKNLIEKQRILL